MGGLLISLIPKCTDSLMCQMLRAIFIALVIEFQDNIADMVRYVF